MIGAIVADRLWGKYNTIIWLSLVYCAGHAVLAVGEDSLPGMYLGLGLIAIGSGGIKPCVSAHVGDQFGRGNWRLVTKVFQAFYWIINFGSFFATLMIPWLKKEYGTSVAFGIPGILMFIATVWFWMGRKKFVHIQPQRPGRLGAYDAISGSLLFMGFIGLPMFFTSILSPFAFWLAVAFCIASGLKIFSIRQAIEEDDGFLAVMIHASTAWIKKALGKVEPAQNEPAENAGQAVDDVVDAIPVDELAPDDADESPLRRHWFFGDACRKFGVVATEGPMAVLRIISVFFLISVFWALFDQHSSSWIRQAKRMDLHLDFLGMSIDLLPSQIAALNPLMVMMLIPINNWLIYPAFAKLGYVLSPLRKMTIGMFVASIAFMAVALIQEAIDTGSASGVKVHVVWQVLPYFLMTQAEVMVSITGLEFAYTQAPRRMKSTVMGFWLLCVALGSKIVIIMTGMESLSLADFFWVFTGLMAAAGVLFGLRARVYEGKEYTH
jgi:POT family proton-dependent oligopeptide transporter